MRSTYLIALSRSSSHWLCDLKHFKVGNPWQQYECSRLHGWCARCQIVKGEKSNPKTSINSRAIILNIFYNSIQISNTFILATGAIFKSMSGLLLTAVWIPWSAPLMNSKPTLQPIFFNKKCVFYFSHAEASFRGWRLTLLVYGGQYMM